MRSTLSGQPPPGLRCIQSRKSSSTRTFCQRALWAREVKTHKPDPSLPPTFFRCCAGGRSHWTSVPSGARLPPTPASTGPTGPGASFPQGRGLGLGLGFGSSGTGHGSGAGGGAGFGGSSGGCDSTHQSNPPRRNKPRRRFVLMGSSRDRSGLHLVVGQDANPAEGPAGLASCPTIRSLPLRGSGAGPVRLVAQQVGALVLSGLAAADDL